MAWFNSSLFRNVIDDHTGRKTGVTEVMLLRYGNHPREYTLQKIVQNMINNSGERFLIRV